MSFFNIFENRKYKELKKLIDSQTISGLNLHFFVDASLECYETNS